VSSVESAAGADVEVRRGRVPVVVYAPHGGRRQRAVRRGDSVNDLHTADIATELARALDGYALVNRTTDRNVADLNRISALTGNASIVLATLRCLIEEARAGGSVVPLVLIVHGWNVTLPACDLGIGIVERDGELFGAHPTVSRETFDGFVRDLARRLDARDIEAPLGRRYPASGRDNATQLFSGRHREHADANAAALSALAAGGGVDAVQLELAIPLRWPGRHRDGFVAATLEAAASEAERRARGAGASRSRSEWSLPSSVSTAGQRVPPGWSVQAVLSDGGGLFAGAESTGPCDAAARLCLVRPDGRMLLFVGEGTWNGDPGSYEIGGFRLQAETGDAPRLVLDHDGPIVVYPTHDAFCDLELGLAGARVVDARAHLVLDVEGSTFGRLHGSVVTDEERLDVDATAVWERGGRRGGSGGVRSRIFVTTGPCAPAVDDECRWRTDDSGEINEIDLRIEERALVARVLTRIPVYRVVAKDVVVKVTFGTAQLADGAGSGTGATTALALFERVEIVAPT